MAVVGSWEKEKKNRNKINITSNLKGLVLLYHGNLKKIHNLQKCDCLVINLDCCIKIATNDWNPQPKSVGDHSWSYKDKKSVYVSCVIIRLEH